MEQCPAVMKLARCIGGNRSQSVRRLAAHLPGQRLWRVGHSAICSPADTAIPGSSLPMRLPQVQPQSSVSVKAHPAVCNLHFN